MMPTHSVVRTADWRGLYLDVLLALGASVMASTINQESPAPSPTALRPPPRAGNSWGNRNKTKSYSYGIVARIAR